MDKIWVVVQEYRVTESCSCGNTYETPENDFLSSWSTEGLAQIERTRLLNLSYKNISVYPVRFVA